MFTWLRMDIAAVADPTRSTARTSCPSPRGTAAVSPRDAAALHTGKLHAGLHAGYAFGDSHGVVIHQRMYPEDLLQAYDQEFFEDTNLEVEDDDEEDALDAGGGRPQAHRLGIPLDDGLRDSANSPMPPSWTNSCRVPSASLRKTMRSRRLRYVLTSRFSRMVSWNMCASWVT